MNLFKYIISVCLFSLGVSAVAQQNNNVFLDRAFWKGNPDLETVKHKAAEGNNAAAFNEYAFDAIVYALIEKADDDVINYLLTINGNTIDKKNHDSPTYLHWAAYAGKTGIMKTLLDQGASVTVLDSHGNTPLTFAAGAGQMDMEVYDLFIGNGVNIAEEKNEDGANALLLIAPSLKSEKDLAYFTNKGLDLNITDDKGNGIFNYAAKKGNIDFLKLLVKKGIEYKKLNNNGGNAFLFAAQGARGYNNPLAVYEYLKSLGLQGNIVTRDGYSPMHRLAYRNTDPAIFNFFISAGADVNQEDADGNTPFLNATSQNSLEMVQLLAKSVNDFSNSNKEGQTPLMQAVWQNNPEVVEFLLQKGGDALAKDAHGNTLAYYLIASFDSAKPENFERKLKMLQEKGLQLNTIQAEGNTLYHIAAKENDLPLLKRLAAFDIPINKTNDEGLTVLHLAAMKAANTKILNFLLSQGADKTIKTQFGETVFELASENEQLQKQQLALNFLQ